MKKLNQIYGIPIGLFIGLMTSYTFNRMDEGMTFLEVMTSSFTITAFSLTILATGVLYYFTKRKEKDTIQG